jgi:hypothetical protein
MVEFVRGAVPSCSRFSSRLAIVDPSAPDNPVETTHDRSHFVSARACLSGCQCTLSCGGGRSDALARIIHESVSFAYKAPHMETPLPHARFTAAEAFVEPEHDTTDYSVPDLLDTPLTVAVDQTQASSDGGPPSFKAVDRGPGGGSRKDPALRRSGGPHAKRVVFLSGTAEGLSEDPTGRPPGLTPI